MIANVRRQARLRDNVDTNAEKAFEIELHADEVEEAARGLELDEQVEVAGRRRVTARTRAEDANVIRAAFARCAGSRRPEARATHEECSEQSLALHRAPEPLCSLHVKPLPPSLRPLFWEVAFERLEVERHADSLLARVLESGKLDDVRWLVATYGMDRIHRALDAPG